MLRVISEFRPAWVVGENVAGIVNMALDQVCADLENEGYAVQAFIIPACAVDAPHRRDRCAIIANRYGAGLQAQGPKQQKARVAGIHEDVAHAESIGLQRVRSFGEQIGIPRPEKEQSERCCDVLSNTDHRSRALRGNWELPAVEETQGQRTNHGGRAPEYVTGEWWPAEPNVGRVANGVPYRVDRLKCLGNAVVPQQFYPVFQTIADIERGVVHG